jgi:hypothetical protein
MWSGTVKTGVGAVCACLALAALDVSAAEAADRGWERLPGGARTICSDGSAYSFFVRPADPARLLIYFQGGGACWFHRNCSPERDPSYKISVADDDPARYGGIFDFDNPANPFADYSVVFAPYCSADVFLGDTVREYLPGPDEETDAPPVTIHHNGFNNAAAVLSWAYANYPEPERVFVTGSSAGSIPSPYYAMQVADHYPDAHIAQLGDGSGGYRRDAAATSPQQLWGTLEVLGRQDEFAGLTDATFSYESLYIAAARRHPEMIFAEFDTAEDATQKRYLAMSGSETTKLLTLLRANHADIRAAVENFRAYVAGGEMHTILGRPEFYTYRVGTVSVRDWVDALARGEDVNDVSCTDCGEPEVLSTAE